MKLNFLIITVINWILALNIEIRKVTIPILKLCTNILRMDEVIIRLALVNYGFKSQVHFQLLIHFYETNLEPTNYA